MSMRDSLLTVAGAAQALPPSGSAPVSRLSLADEPAQAPGASSIVTERAAPGNSARAASARAAFVQPSTDGG
jgi:hypothetical protein